MMKSNLDKFLRNRILYIIIIPILLIFPHIIYQTIQNLDYINNNPAEFVYAFYFIFLITVLYSVLIIWTLSYALRFDLILERLTQAFFSSDMGLIIAYFIPMILSFVFWAFYVRFIYRIDKIDKKELYTWLVVMVILIILNFIGMINILKTF